MRHRNHRPRFRTWFWSAPLCAAGLLLSLTGCSGGAVDTEPPPSPDGATARLCKALHRALPDKVNGLERRGTDPDSDLTAAWGGKPVVLRCGVPLPSELTPGTEDYNPSAPSVGANGVYWLPRKSREGVRFVTVEREANVEVWVPRDYAPGYPDALLDLADAVKKTVPERL
ncbi:DUF3515 domain-containing protein [Wenjunlia tyrosinilytica]|uniref:DUF3515 domain-containing protein n=1 Tax=Wenjunlia tyrosinilytica TaxID=1544741 RepID=A0A918DZH0_9ACTN|nr:DUF3515 domain-containing protein [Wenjunlia tyrosinilytica]GGO93871.1 hypothetical protein GCM10012280_47390 [Wenjunlia tyrosinilytica]